MIVTNAACCSVPQHLCPACSLAAARVAQNAGESDDVLPGPQHEPLPSIFDRGPSRGRPQQQLAPQYHHAPVPVLNRDESDEVLTLPTFSYGNDVLARRR